MSLRPFICLWHWKHVSDIYTEENGYWTLQSGNIKENIASLNLHKKCGFCEIGYLERLGRMENDMILLVEKK